MNIIKMGDYIKEERIKQGLTQEKLCEGICTAATLSRLENNQQTPTRNRINALLQRLGLPDDRFFALLSENEERIKALQREIQDTCILFRRAEEEERPRIRREALGKVMELETVMEKDDQLTRQYILGIKAALGGPDGAYSIEKRLEVLMEAILLTVPRFRLEEISFNRYSIEETTLINQIAVTYRKAGEKRKAIDIYRQLLKYIEKNDQNLSQYTEQFCLVAHNYALTLAYEKRYEEAVELSQRGKQLCSMHGAYQFLPGFSAILAECYFFTGKREESIEQYNIAYYLYLAINDKDNLMIIKREMKERFNIDPPIYI